MAPRKTAVFTAQLLGVIQSVLVLSLLAIAGLLGVLGTTRGSAQIDKGTISALDPWIISHQVGSKGNDAIVDDSGLFPIAAANLESKNPIHQFGGMLALGTLQSFPAFRTNRDALLTLTATALILVLLLALVSRQRLMALAKASCEAAAALRRQIHRQMYRLGESSLPNEGTGPVVNIFTREVNDVRDGLAKQLDVESTVPMLTLGLVCFLLLVDWKTTLFIAALGGLTWLAVRGLRKANDERIGVALRDAAIDLSALHEDLGLLRTVRVHGMEEVDKARFDEHLDRYMEADVRRMIVKGHGGTLQFIVIGTSIVAAVGLLTAVVVLRQHSPISSLFLVATLAGLLVPIMKWTKLRRTLDQSERSAGSIFRYLDRSPELHQAGGAAFLPPIKQRISFENVSLQSQSGHKLLDGLTVEIEAGSRVAIMGLEEESKYALVCLIPRLIDPKVGRVRIDGTDLRDVTLESVRSQVSTVLQADLVFSDTVLANIALGDTSFDLPRVIEAAKLAHAHSFIQDLPQGYDTQIGPIGHYLTSDQQYRIGLARAALHDPSILIIEEPLSPLGDETKAFIDDTLARLSPGRTVIILPHRLSTIRSCDQVVVLHNGRVDAVGPPKELQHSSKLYRHLQYIEFNQFATGEVEAGQMNG
jgi:ABC-type multidrug transport system fused ATPase/permease subunit